MTREMYESLALVDLKAIAKQRGMKGTTALKKADLINAMLAKDAEEAREAKAARDEARQQGKRRLKKRSRLVKKM